MNNYLPKKIKINFFSKLINKVRTFFFKTKEENIIINDKTLEEIEQQDKNNFVNNLQVDTVDINIKYEQKVFMNNLTKHPQLLENFSNDRLEKILQYYLEENEKKTERLNEIHAT